MKLFLATKDLRKEWVRFQSSDEKFDYFHYINLIIARFEQRYQGVACKYFKNRFNTETNIKGMSEVCEDQG